MDKEKEQFQNDLLESVRQMNKHNRTRTDNKPMTKTKWTRKYNERQRKKLRVGEFQELVVMIEAKVNPSLTGAQREAWLDDFVENAIEKNGLICGAGMNDGFWCYASHEEDRQSVTEEQRAALVAWLADKSEVFDVKISPLFDANLVA
jgi:uncharacterized protein